MRYHDTLPSGGKPPILRVLAQCRRASPYLGQPQVTRQLAHRREQSARHKLPCGDVQANLRPNLLIRGPGSLDQRRGAVAYPHGHSCS